MMEWIDVNDLQEGMVHASGATLVHLYPDDGDGVWAEWSDGDQGYVDHGAWMTGEA